MTKCGNNTCRAQEPEDFIEFLLEGWVEVLEDDVRVPYCGRCAGEILQHD